MSCNIQRPQIIIILPEWTRRCCRAPWKPLSTQTVIKALLQSVPCTLKSMQNSHQSSATERAKQPSKHSYRAHDTQSEQVALQSKPGIDWQSRLATERTARVHPPWHCCRAIPIDRYRACACDACNAMRTATAHSCDVTCLRHENKF